jgi:hypothetical protein
MLLILSVKANAIYLAMPLSESLKSISLRIFPFQLKKFIKNHANKNKINESS